MLVLLAALLPSAALATVANNILLTDYVAGSGAPQAAFNARSLDGSPYELWHAPAASAANATKWVIDIQGGAWCQDLASCAARAYGNGDGTGCYLGSSNASCFNSDSERCADKAPAMPFECLPACNGARWCGGLFVNSSATNPLTHDWHQVLLPYHDGQSFTGGAEAATPVLFKGRTLPLWFRGHANFRAALHWLLTVGGMSGATEVALTGNSAGGLATFFHADELAAALPGARVWAAPDSGLFYASDPAHPSWAAGLRAMVAMANSTGGLDASCVAARSADPASCAFPEVGAQHVTTPLFVVQGRYDPALLSIANGIDTSNASAVNGRGNELLSALQGAVLGRSANAAFVTACAQHCGQWAQGVDGDFNVTIGGVSALPALIAWRAGAQLPPGNRWLQVPGNSFPCPGCCSGGPVAPPNVTLTLLTEAAASAGAVALDGSPGALYIDRGAEAGKWIIYQQGGGWCSSIEQCQQRANSTLGTSTLLAPWSTSVMREVDYLSNDPAINPVMWNWTHVYLPYLDGFSQTGDVEAPVVSPPGAPPIYFRGARILAAQQAYLRSAGLGQAEELVVSGCSAGGLSTYLHADKWADAFPAARVTALADSGYFLNFDWTTGRAAAGQPGDASFPSNASYPWRMWWMYQQLAGNTSALAAPCLAAQAPGSQWLCLFAENLAPHLRTPLFALQSYHDSYQVAAIANVRNVSAPGAAAAINAFGAQLNARVKAGLLGAAAPHGAALDACLHHCGGRGAVWPALPFADNRTTQNGAWAEWYAARGSGERLWEQVSDFPCTWCCGAKVTGPAGRSA